MVILGSLRVSQVREVDDHVLRPTDEPPPAGFHARLGDREALALAGGFGVAQEE